MNLVDSYTMTPGSCRLCSDAKTPVVDTLMDIDLNGFDGRLYICASCVGHLAGMIGWSSPERIEKVQKENSRYRKQIERLKQDFAAAKEFVSEAFTPDSLEDDAA